MIKSRFLKHGELEQDFELNLASIIDCFVVLIAFVLVSTSFFSIGILDADLAGGSSAQSSAVSDAVVIELRTDGSILVKKAGSRPAVVRDREALNRMLAEMKDSEELKSAIVTADDSVSYRDVMASMEVAKAFTPAVSLGGF